MSPEDLTAAQRATERNKGDVRRKARERAAARRARDPDGEKGKRLAWLARNPDYYRLWRQKKMASEEFRAAEKARQARFRELNPDYRRRYHEENEKTAAYKARIAECDSRRHFMGYGEYAECAQLLNDLEAALKPPGNKADRQRIRRTRRGDTGERTK